MESKKDIVFPMMKRHMQGRERSQLDREIIRGSPKGMLVMLRKLVDEVSACGKTPDRGNVYGKRLRKTKLRNMVAFHAGERLFFCLFFLIDTF